LQLSKAAKDYHPGQGVYRSSYKNAMRLARTEVNIAYRTANYERWQQINSVVGIEIHLSNNHTLNGQPFSDICDELQGKYPKDFKWTGWHPQCRCYVTSILKTIEELKADNERIMNGEETNTASVNEVKDVPDKFKEWVKNNESRIKRAEERGTLPYFLKDNKQIIEIKRLVSDNKNDSFFSSKWNVEFDNVKNISELKTEMQNQLNKLQNKIEIMFPDNYPLDIAKAQSSEFINLCKEYKLEVPCSKFNATRKSGGEVYWLDVNGNKINNRMLAGKVKSKEINISATSDSDRTLPFATTKSRCDANKLSISTSTHEFGHLLFDSEIWETKNTVQFRNELIKIEKAYKMELKKFKPKSKQWNDVFLGEYSGRSIDEFLAESFQEYRNSSNPSKYAKLVGDLINKHFKN
jgi:hypothetical protein